MSDAEEFKRFEELTDRNAEFEAFLEETCSMRPLTRASINVALKRAYELGGAHATKKLLSAPLRAEIAALKQLVAELQTLLSKKMRTRDS